MIPDNHICNMSTENTIVNRMNITIVIIHLGISNKLSNIDFVLVNNLCVLINKILYPMYLYHTTGETHKGTRIPQDFRSI
jgi:hypothetical protein